MGTCGSKGTPQADQNKPEIQQCGTTQDNSNFCSGQHGNGGNSSGGASGSYPLQEQTIQAVPKATIQAVPKATIQAVPKATIQAVPKATIQAVPKATIQAVPKATIPTKLCSCPGGGPCVYYSKHIRDLDEGTRTESEITNDYSTASRLVTLAEENEIGEANRKYFDEVLVKNPDWETFFSKFEGLIVGEPIGKGGQAEVFAATLPGQRFRGRGLVAKVFEKKWKLEDLEKQWPPQLLSVVRGNSTIPSGIDRRKGYGFPLRNIMGGTFIREGKFKNRFAFVMERRWGDLRKLIDDRMLELLQANKHGPPFSAIEDVYRLIRGASNDMRRLHKDGVIHRDIKASNLLLANSEVKIHELPDLMDFECAIGTWGTRFWRAPEILRQLQPPRLPNAPEFSMKADIYSFGMLCYEIITGCFPFEDHPPSDYSIVLVEKKTPRLPSDLNPILEQLLIDCWKHDPEDRPSAKEVGYRVEEFGRSIGLNSNVEPYLVND